MEQHNRLHNPKEVFTIMHMTLLIGKKGQMAWAIQKQFKTTLKVMGSGEFNLLNTQNIRTVLDQVKPTTIINAAGVSHLSDVQKDPERSKILNVEAPTQLATWAKERNALFIHFTGVDVFDGKGSDFRQESDKVSPINELGAQQVEAEANIFKLAPQHLIFRTTWLYSPVGHNFIRQIAHSKDSEFKARAEQVSSPTSAAELAKAIVKVIEKIQGLPQIPSGIYHATGYGTATQFEWAQECLNQAMGLGFRSLAQKIVLDKSELETKNIGPINARLSNQRLLRAFGVQLPDWKDSLIKALQELKKIESL